MPLSKHKHPDKYPLRFHQIIAKGRGVWWMGLEQATEAAATLEMRRFGYFRAALAKTPRHRLYERFQAMFIRGRVMLNPAGYGYDVCITIKTHCTPHKPRLPHIPQTNDKEICKSLEEFLSQGVAEGD